MEAEEPGHGAPAPVPATAELSAVPEALMRSSQTPTVGPDAQEGQHPAHKWAEGCRPLETQQRDGNECAAEGVASPPAGALVDVHPNQENRLAEARDMPEGQDAGPRSPADRQARTPAPPERRACPVQAEHLNMVPGPSELSSRSEVEFRPELPSLTLGTRQAEEKEETAPDAPAQPRCLPPCEELPAETDPLQGSGCGTLGPGEEPQGSPGRERLVCPREAEELQEPGQEERAAPGEAACSDGLLGEQEQMGERVKGTQGGQRQDEVELAQQGEQWGLNGELGGESGDEWERGTQGQEGLEVGRQRGESRGPDESRRGAQCQEKPSSARRAGKAPGRQEHQGLPGTPMPGEQEGEEGCDGPAPRGLGGERSTEEGGEPGGPPTLALAVPEFSPWDSNARTRVSGEPSPEALTPALEPTGCPPQPISVPSSFPTAGSPGQGTAQGSQLEGCAPGMGAAPCGGTEVTSPRTRGSAPFTSAEGSPSIAAPPSASPPIAIPRKKASLAARSPETARASFSSDNLSPRGASETPPAALCGPPSASPLSPLASSPGPAQHPLSSSFPGSHRTPLAQDLAGWSLSFSHAELPQRPPKPAAHGSVTPRRDRKSSRDCSVTPESPSSSATPGQDSGQFPSDPHRSPHSQPWGSPQNSAFAPGSPAYGSSPPPVFVDMRLHELAPPAPPEKRHAHHSAGDRASQRGAGAPTLRQCSCPPSPVPCGSPKGSLPEAPDPLVARQYRPLPSTPDDPHPTRTSSSPRLRYNKPLPPTPDLCQPPQPPGSHNSPRIYRPLPPVPDAAAPAEPPPLPPKSRGRSRSIQAALVNSGGQVQPRPAGPEWTASSPHSAGRTSWPPATGRSADALAPSSRSKSEASPSTAFSNPTTLLSPPSPTSPWTLGLQAPAFEPGLSGESEAPARGALRRAAPQEGANGLRRLDLGSARQPEKPSHPHLEKASSWPHRRDPGRPPQGSGTPPAASVEGSSKHKGWHRQGLRRPSILPEGSADTRGPAVEKPPGPSDTIVFREKKPKEMMGGFSRRCSKLINSSQLLYQEYSDVVLNKEIQSQQRRDGPAEAPEPASPRQPRKALVSSESYLQRLSMASRSSLWQEIPVVRNSAVLLSMTHEDQKLQEAKFELIVSEASYLRSLNVAVDHFQHSAQLRAVLTNQDQQWLFSRLQDVRDVSTTFLSDLEENFENNIFTFHVCDVVLNHASHFRRVYLPYVTNQSYQERTFQNLLNTNSSFREVLEKLESDPVCQRLSLKSFLILPFQRITRLKLLLQNILKRTQPGSSEEAEATKAHHALEKLIRDCNSNVQRMRRTEELIYLSQKIEFECKIFPLISQSRWLVKSGELVALEFSVSPGLRRKLNTRPVHLHLFNDCLLLSRPREGRFLVFDHAPFSAIRGEKCEMKLHGSHKNLFRLFLLHNTQGTQAEFLFSTETQSEKLRWISALAMPREELDLLECCDAPQVQCLRAYKPRENDELALEKADVVMVTQQSSDGWLEGMRLSDGERGWFPVQQVEFISNPEIRSQNLKEAQRVKMAKLQLVEQQP
ncbi:rho guanine nucleotide exchange factor 5 [Molossus molossus]|uniref:Rho guanine nucleotide exchange factor 5 n=1 Tax=Molossus molossus TaxID=27622 RepID=A0A7J8H9J2_MOLMO|nr:rho guanine nucleotide exchange factor 5 [Molossus molossus]KAF6468916.1 Rho guanine nucleotide exchange factor 5 [Molossus molossus]